MIDRMFEQIKTVDPITWPQAPFDDAPEARERSMPTYGIHEELDITIPMRDGIRLSADVFRPAAPGKRFPALIAVSPYTRQLQRTTIVDGQNEAGITAFWVPRGYAHVMVDVRGTNESEGHWDHMGPTEHADLVDMIEWVAAQPWCDGNVGMTGESYYGWSQLMAATQQPPALKAIFALSAAVDLYRERYMHGGIYQRGVGCWFYVLRELNGRRSDMTGIDRHQRQMMAIEHPFDGPYYQERLSWTRLDQVRIPTYLAASWRHVGSHLRGAFEAWDALGHVPRRLLVGPTPRPRKPLGAYHGEALRWYDHHLKGMDTGVMDGPPIRLWVPGADAWRGEHEWPIARTDWREYYLGGDGVETGRLSPDLPSDGQASYTYDPSTTEGYLGGPALSYRTDALVDDLEVTGPLVLTLHAASSATDTDWFVTLSDEAPDGRARELTNGWLRASHRELDPVRSKPWRPFHPHLRSDPLEPGQACEFAIEIWPTSRLFRAGHRIRLDVASCDDQSRLGDAHSAIAVRATNTILHGRSHPSRLLVPVIPPG